MKKQSINISFVLVIAMLLSLSGSIFAHNDQERIITGQETITTNNDEDRFETPGILESYSDLLQLSASSNKRADVVFVVDSTGSMEPYINNVKINIAAFSQYLFEKGISLRIGVVEYKDISYDGLDSTYVHKINHSPWHTIDEFRSTLDSIYVDGGGPIEETPLDALGFLLDDLTMLWSVDAYRFAVVLTDAPFRTDNRHGFTSLHDVAGELASRNINTSVVTMPNIFDEYSVLTTKTNGILGDIDSKEFATVLQELANSIMDVTEKPKEAIYVLPGYMGSNLYSFSGEIIWVDTHIGTSNNLWQEFWGKSSYMKSNEFGTLSNVMVDYNRDQYGPFDSYKDLVDKLKKEFDKSNGGKYDVIFFPYNWLGDLNISAKTLEEHINSRGYNRVTFVTHSTGGLLAATYIARSRENKLKVEKAILVAAPLYGTYAALEPIELGLPGKWQQKLYHDNIIFGGFVVLVGNLTFSNWLREVTKNSPTTYQLLPSMEYLNHIPFIDTALFESRYPIMTLNEYYGMLNKSSNINSRLTNNPGSGRFIDNDHKTFRERVLKSITNVLLEVNTTLIGSKNSGWPTPASPVYGNKFFGLGDYGLKDIRYSGSGDGTVMGFSAAASDRSGRNILYFKDFPFTSHGDLVEKAVVLDYICNVIKDPIMVGPPPPESFALATSFIGMSKSVKLNITADVPVDINITDSGLNLIASVQDGLPVGFDVDGFVYTSLTVEEDETSSIVYLPNSGYKVTFSSLGRESDIINFEVIVATLDIDGYTNYSAKYVASETGTDGKILSLDMLSQQVDSDTIGSLAESPAIATHEYYGSWEIDSEIVLQSIGDTTTINLFGDDITAGKLDASDLAWFSSDPSIVSVSGGGVVEAKDHGIAYVYAAATDGSYRILSCQVTVTLTATSVSFDDVNMVVDEKVLIQPLFNPSKVTETQITYLYDTVECPIYINELGVITALMPGTVEVSGTASGGAKNIFNVTVRDNSVIAVQSILVEPSNLNVGLNEEFTLTAVIAPAGASNQNIDWYVEDDSKVSVVKAENDTCVFRGEQIGVSVITAVTIDGGYTAKATITVTDHPDQSFDPYPNPTPEPIPPAILGDITGSGNITVADVTLLIQYVLGLKVITEDQKKAADVNGDNRLNIQDVVLIKKMVLKLIDKFPVE